MNRTITFNKKDETKKVALKVAFMLSNCVYFNEENDYPCGQAQLRQVLFRSKKALRI